MKIARYLQGILLGVATFYALGFTSLLWLGYEAEQYLWALLLCACILGVVGVVISFQPFVGVIAATTMTILVAIFFALGNPVVVSGPALGVDYVYILLHAARSVLVIGAIALMAGVSIPRVIFNGPKGARRPVEQEGSVPLSR